MKFLSLRLSGRLIASFFLLSVAACAPKPPQFQSMDVTGAQWGQDFSLPDLQGKTTAISDFRGKAVAVFFGFLYCPDACPTHLTKMVEVKKLLGPKAQELAVVFITVDPERDAPESLSKFLAAFDPEFVGLRGNIEQTQAVARDFRVYFKKVPSATNPQDPLAYTIDHTTFAYIFDPEGRLRLVAPHDITAEKLAQDVEQLLVR
ncbi:MAG: SCO family protein [Burkholderiaceae bacterium]